MLDPVDVTRAYPHGPTRITPRLNADGERKARLLHDPPGRTPQWPADVAGQAKAAGNYNNAALIKLEAQANGYVEAIALGTDGLVSEGSGQNLFSVKSGMLESLVEFLARSMWLSVSHTSYGLYTV